MVKERCISWLNDPFIQQSGSEITNQVTQPNGWGIMDLYADNWVPDIDTNVEVEDDDSTAEDESLLVAAYSLDFSTMKNDPLSGDMGDEHFASCWTQYAGETAQAQDFANKCFEVLSWCNLLCPRDTPQTADHVMCKHCVLFGFEEGNWSGDVFSNQLNGDSVSKSMCGFFPDRCDCRYQPGVGGVDGAEVTDPSKGWAGYPIGWEFCPKVTMAAKYNSGLQASCRQCPDDYVPPEGDVASTCDVGCVWEDDGQGQLTQIKKLFPGSTGPENYFGSLEGQQAEQECLDDAEAFVINMGGCSNDEFYAQEAQETRDIPGQRTDAENPMLGGAPLEGRTTSFQEAAALR